MENLMFWVFFLSIIAIFCGGIIQNTYDFMI